MTNLKDKRHFIISELAKGDFVSGQALGEQLGISRAAVSKHIQALIDVGLDIFSVTGRGYKLASQISFLSKDAIQRHYNNPLKLELHGVIDSTNNYITQKLRQGEKLETGFTVISECQTAGKGRRGREWVSPFGSHLYLSRYLKTTEGLAELSGLSLAIGIAVKRAIKSISNVDAKLKWPNDVLINQKKVAGVLVEAEGQSDGICHLVIGIGVNINMPDNVSSQIDQPWTDLNTEIAKQVDRNVFCASMMKSLDEVLLEFQHTRLENLYEEWNKSNAFRDSEVILSSARTQQMGICKGIDYSGALVLEDKVTKTTKRIFGGELSLRKAL